MREHDLSTRSLNRLEGVEEKGIMLVKLAIKLSPIDFSIPWMGGYRSVEDQLAIFKEGNSTCDGTNKKSYHQSGKAIDFVPYVDGKSNDSHRYYFMIIGAFFAAAETLGMEITSGANWDNDEIWIEDQKFNDLRHIQWK